MGRLGDLYYIIKERIVPFFAKGYLHVILLAFTCVSLRFDYIYMFSNAIPVDQGLHIPSTSHHDSLP
jgi:hypothetical protein